VKTVIKILNYNRKNFLIINIQLLILHAGINGLMGQNTPPAFEVPARSTQHEEARLKVSIYFIKKKLTGTININQIEQWKEENEYSFYSENLYLPPGAYKLNQKAKSLAYKAAQASSRENEWYGSAIIIADIEEYQGKVEGKPRFRSERSYYDSNGKK
jgi:hypothetical protein